MAAPIWCQWSIRRKGRFERRLPVADLRKFGNRSIFATLPKPGWQEHTFTRHVSAEWLKQLREHGGLPQPAEDLETFHAVDDSVRPLPAMKVPGIVEGVISRAAETQRIALHAEVTQDLVLEVNTADASS